MPISFADLVIYCHSDYIIFQRQIENRSASLTPARWSLDKPPVKQSTAASLASLLPVLELSWFWPAELCFRVLPLWGCKMVLSSRCFPHAMRRRDFLNRVQVFSDRHNPGLPKTRGFSGALTVLRSVPKRGTQDPENSFFFSGKISRNLFLAWG